MHDFVCVYVWKLEHDAWTQYVWDKHVHVRNGNWLWKVYEMWYSAFGIQDTYIKGYRYIDFGTW